MSGIAHAVKKVFKGVVGIVKKVWKPLVIAAAVYFTGGMALGAMGALGAGGSALAGAGAGFDAALGGLGIGSGAGIGSAFAAGAGTLGEAAGGALMGAPALAASGELVGPGGALLDASGAELAGAPAALAGGGEAATGGFETLGGGGVVSGSGGGLSGQLSNPAVSDIPTSVTNALPSSVGDMTPGAPSSLWDKSLSVAGQIMKTPGMPSLIGGFFQNYEQGKMMEAQQKWAEAHAPGQIAGGAKGAWSGGAFPMNKNLTPNTPMPTAAKLPALTPYTQPSPQMPGTQMPGYGQPGSQSSQYPGYGTPGYGQQPPIGSGYQPQVMPNQEEDGGLLSQTPFIDSPYDQSYA